MLSWVPLINRCHRFKYEPRSHQVAKNSKIVSKRPLAQHAPQRNYAKIALFGDTHFQDRGLKRIIKSSDWIIDEISKRNCDAVVCLGDVLNTRELVSVRALSASLNFFDLLSKRLNGRNSDDSKTSNDDKSTHPTIPIHVLLGNHDINLKHSRKISSLDALGMSIMSDSGIILHRNITEVQNIVDGVDSIMVPYHEDQAGIAQYLEDYVARVGSNKARKTLVFGHLAITGAQQNNSPYRYRGPLKSSSFAPFERTFSGHFHHHHELVKNRIVYVGSPMQFNFGDAGDTRGIVIYDSETKKWELIENPFSEQYIKESDIKLAKQLQTLFSSPSFADWVPNPNIKHDIKQNDDFIDEDQEAGLEIPDNRFKDKFIQIQMKHADLDPGVFEQLRDLLLQAGAAGVTKASNLSKLIKDQALENESNNLKSAFRHYGTSTVEDIEHLVLEFAKSVRKSYLESIEAEKQKEALLNSDSDASKITSSETDADDQLHLENTPEKKSTKSKSKSQKNDQDGAPSSRKRHTLVQLQSSHFLEDDQKFESLVQVGLQLAKSSAKPVSSTAEKASTFTGRLHTIYMKNFMGIQGELTIPFSQMNSGIWLIEGDNGAGKSTIFEALVWAQFGEFLRSGMQKDFAINDKERSCVVRLTYDNGFVIERSRKRGRHESLRTFKLHTENQLQEDMNDQNLESQSSDVLKDDYKVNADDGDEELLMNREPSSIGQTPSKKSKKSNLKSKKKSSSSMTYQEESELGDIRNTQKLLCQTLGVNFETFSKSVVLGQNILTNFVSGNKEQRRTIIEEMLGLEKFNEWLEAARTERSSLEQQLLLLGQKRDILQKEHSDMISAISTRQATIETQKQRLTQLEAELNELEIHNAQQYENLQAQIDTQKAELESEEMINFLKQIGGIEKMDENQDNLVNPQLSNLFAEICNLESHLKETSSQKANNQMICASCGQTVTQQHIENMILKSNNLISTASSLFDKAKVLSNNRSKSAKQALQALGKLKGIFEQHQQEIASNQALIRKHQELQLVISKLETSLANTKSQGAEELSDISRDIYVCKMDLYRLAAMIVQTNDNAAILAEKIAMISTQIEETKEKCTMVKFWEMAFDKQSKGTVGTVRAFVFQDVVKELNAICNSYMEQLQTKQQYNLRVTLTADLEIEQVYGKRSGGERKRTDLAILFSMFELVRNQSNYVPDYIMLDEVFDSLDQQGREMVGQVLTTLAKRLEKILVITHTDVASGLSIAGVMNVTMKHDQLGNPLGTSIDIIHR